MRIMFTIVTLLAWMGSASAQMTELEYSQLPREVRDTIRDIRANCKELNPDFKPYAIEQGIMIVDLDDSGSKNIVLDAENVCNGQVPGANCSNRGCDMTIFKETSRGQWQKIFKEHLYAKYLAIDWETMRLQLMVVSIYAGDPRCQPDANKDYSSGKSCNLIVTYRNNQWNWQLIR